MTERGPLKIHMKKIVWILSALVLAMSSLAQAKTVFVDEVVTFRAQSEGATRYEWTFPGGVVIKGETVEFKFTQSGPQRVKLRVEGEDGDANEIVQRVLVANKDRPTAVISAQLDGQEIVRDHLEAQLGQVIELTSNSFFETKTDEAFSKVWTVNGRNVPESELAAAFDAIGTYQVVLTVQDLEAPQQRDQDTLQVWIVNQAPRVTALAARHLGNGQVQVKTQARDPDGTIDHYKFEVLEAGAVVQTQVVFRPDTIFDLSHLSGERAYDFRVTVADDRFATTTLVTPEALRLNLAQTNHPPLAQIQVLPGNQGRVNETFSFAAQTSDADNDNLSYEWKLPSGERFVTPQFTTTFTDPGAYQVQLNVSDGIDRVSDELTINIQALPEDAMSLVVPTAAIALLEPGPAGSTSTVFRFYSAPDPVLEGSLQYEWDFGNGSKSFTPSAAVVYPEPGNYTVTLTVKNGELEARDSVKVEVILGEKDVEKTALLERTEALETALMSSPESEEESDGVKLSPEALATQAFLSAQVEQLKTFAQTPPVLIAGIDRPGQESVKNRLARLQARADQAEAQAEGWLALGAELAALRQPEQQKALAEAQDAYDDAVDDAVRAELGDKIERLKKQLEVLEKIIHPEQALSAAEIQVRQQALQEDLIAQQRTVVTQQQEYLVTRLAAVESQLTLVQDETEKAVLESERKWLQANINQTDLLTNYEQQLLDSQRGLNERLATDLNSTTELLVRTQLDSVEANLESLAKLQQIQQEIANFTDLSVQSPLDLAREFLQAERVRVTQDLLRLRERVEQTTDEIERKALLDGEAALLVQFDRLPKAAEESGLSTLPIIQALATLDHYALVLGRQANETEAGENPLQAQVKAAATWLRGWHKAGYGPQVQLSKLLLDLQRREKTLLADYRAQVDEADKEVLRAKLVVLEAAYEQLSALSQYEVQPNDSLYQAQQKLEQALRQGYQNYERAEINTVRAAIRQTLELLVQRQSWLQRFYRPQRRAQTLADLEMTLTRAAQGAEAEVDLAAFAALGPLVTQGVETQLQTDFENFKMSLKRQTQTLVDSVEKAELEAEIDGLNYQDFATGSVTANLDLFATLLSDLTLKVHTNLFLYADVELENSSQAVLFEWDFGDGEKRFGQHVSHAYHEPGFYRVALTVSDGVTSVQDLFTIRVIDASLDE